MFAIENIYPDFGEISAPFDSIYHKINQKYPGKKHEIIFSGGIKYDGAVNDNFEFEGLGTLTAPEKSDISWRFATEVKTITGIFVPGQGLVCEVIFEDIEDDMKRDLKLVSNTYFEDREKIQRLYKNMFDVRYEWLTLRGKGGKTIKYKGGWMDYVINGPCRIQVDEGPDIEGIAQNGMIFNAKINFSYYKELKSSADDKNKVKFKKKIKFKNGNT